MTKGAFVIARTDHMSLTRGLAASHTSQRVARQMIGITEDHGIK